jgi:phosphatidylglycerol lysyltransferase
MEKPMSTKTLSSTVSIESTALTEPKIEEQKRQSSRRYFGPAADFLFCYISQIANLKKRSVLIWIVTLVTLGSGLVNLFSLIGPSLPERRELLRNIFPLEFLHLSKFLTLLIGFALVVSSINIYKRKKRAYQTVLLLACLSVIFHLTKGLDYEEACASLLLTAVLLSARKIFTVRSSVPDLQFGMARFAIALLAAIGYGVAGFWFLAQKEFGINFTIGDSINTTLRLLFLIGDPRLIPHTRYAHSFLNSIYLMTATTIGYSLMAMFRPAIYQFRTLPHERAAAMDVVSRHGRSSLDYFKFRHDKSYFFSLSQNSFTDMKFTDSTRNVTLLVSPARLH